ncbi:putative amino acid transporter, partial [Aureobasidium melanogenum]
MSLASHSVQQSSIPIMAESYHLARQRVASGEASGSGRPRKKDPGAVDLGERLGEQLWPEHLGSYQGIHVGVEILVEGQAGLLLERRELKSDCRACVSTLVSGSVAVEVPAAKVFGSRKPLGVAWPDDNDERHDGFIIWPRKLSLFSSRTPPRMTSYASIRSPPSDSSSRPNSTASMSRRPRRKENGVHGQASWISSVINLVNTIVGAGVLAMPSALSNMGILLGILVIVWSGLTSGFGLYLQTRCARYLDRGSASFFALSQITYPNAAVIFDAAIAIKCFGVGISYLIIIGDLMPGVVRGFTDTPAADYLLDRHFWVTAFMLVVIPLSFLRRLDSLKYTSIIALVSIGYLVVLVVYHFAKGDDMGLKGEISIVPDKGIVPVLASFPVIVFAYTCHQNMFSILNEIEDNSPFKTTSVVLASIGSSGSIYLLVAITGYLTFGDNVAGNIVAQYIPSVASTIGKAAIVVLVMFSYPLQVHPCRASVDAVLKWRPASRKQPEYASVNGSPSRSTLLNSGSNSQRGRGEMSDRRFAVITTVIIILSYIVAMTVSSLSVVLAYVGSTGSTSISFILPGLFYYKISSPDSPHHQRLLKEDDDEEAETDGEETRGGWNSGSILRKLSLGLAIYGLLVMVVCLVTNTFFVVAH